MVAALLAAGARALEAGRWQDAADAFALALSDLTPGRIEHATASEGLSEARWWLGQVDAALEARADAYASWRNSGDDEAAARAAAWLAREYAAALGNHAAAQGWLARAGTLGTATAAPLVQGWVALTRAHLASEPAAQEDAAAAALAHARAARDGDLEALALARQGLARVAAGDLESGLADLDEAMAAATAGETGRSTLAALCCDLVLAAELSGQFERFAQWNEVVEALAARHGHPGLVGFCATCCAEALTAGGDWSGAEQQLRAALEQLRATGHKTRCVPPAAKLGGLLADQGRFEEALAAVGGDDSPQGLVVQGRLALERDDASAAVALLERAWRRLGGDSLVTVPVLALLVTAQLAAGDRAAAEDTATRLSALADGAGNPRVAGRAALARARVAAAAGDRAGARRELEAALDGLSAAAPGALDTAEAHLELARLVRDEAPDLATVEARAALAGFEGAGAARAVDATAALLRSLGDRSRVGDKKVGVLTNREREVLRLLAQGLTNAEIAARLFISAKTAGNHVSNILAKLGLRSRVEAAAYAALHPGE